MRPEPYPALICVDIITGSRPFSINWQTRSRSAVILQLRFGGHRPPPRGCCTPVSCGPLLEFLLNVGPQPEFYSPSWRSRSRRLSRRVSVFASFIGHSLL